MKPFTMSILNSLGDFFTMTLTSMKPKQASEQTGTDYRLHAFEAAGLLLGIEDLEPEQQKEALVTMLRPAIHQVESLIEDKVNGASEEWKVQQSLEMISRISKGFKQEQVIHHRPELGQVFVKCLEMAVRIPSLCKCPVVYSRVVSFHHRMVELIGEVTLPYLQPAFEVLLQECGDTGQMGEIVTLGHQLATAFKGSLMDFLRVVLPVLLRRVWLCLEADWDWTGRSRPKPDKATHPHSVILDETREKEQLQRLYYGLIYAIFANCDAGLILELDREALQMMLGSIAQGASYHTDLAMKRICFQTFTQMVEQWSEHIQSDVALREYVIGTIGQEVCMRSTIRSALDVRDAATNAFFQDIATCIKTTYIVCGEESLGRLIVPLTEFQFPPEFSTELEARLRANDMKKLKEFFKVVVKRQRANDREASNM